MRERGVMRAAGLDGGPRFLQLRRERMNFLRRCAHTAFN